MKKIFSNSKVKINKPISNANGTLYVESIVKIDEVLENNKVRVIDNIGQIWIISIDNIEAINGE